MEIKTASESQPPARRANRPVRLAYLVSHPIQYQAPLLRRIALALLGGAHATIALPASAQPAPPKPKADAAHHGTAKPAPPKAKPGGKATPARTKKGGKGVVARRPGEPGEPDEATRRIIAVKPRSIYG